MISDSVLIEMAKNAIHSAYTGLDLGIIVESMYDFGWAGSILDEYGDTNSDVLSVEKFADNLLATGYSS